MKWEDVKKDLTSVSPEEQRALEDLAKYCNLGLVTDERVEQAIENDKVIELRDEIRETLR